MANLEEVEPSRWDTIYQIGEIFVYGGITVAFALGIFFLALWLVMKFTRLFIGTDEILEKLNKMERRLDAEQINSSNAETD